MTVLMDDDSYKNPTHMNITESLKALSEQSKPGDAVFIQFSGHGGRVLDGPTDDEAETYDEVIAPSDYQASGLIRDTLIFKTLLAPMRFGVTVTILIDTCDTGMMLDLPYVWTTKADRNDTLAKVRTVPPAEAICFPFMNSNLTHLTPN
jgi:metacaspase-1